jgi:hypothetical protein
MTRSLKISTVSLGCLLLAVFAAAVSKPHVVSFGKWMTVKYTAVGETAALELKVRPLYVDGHAKEFTLGVAHEVTDRLFVVRRAFRSNDALPAEANPLWHWERGGWLLVDRVSGRISPVSLPEFDSYYSAVNWYRDYAAYCGVSDDGKKVYAIIAQLGRHKPVLKEALRDAPIGDQPDAACPPPQWQRQPVRVSFAPAEDHPVTFAIRGHAADLVNSEEEEGTQ